MKKIKFKLRTTKIDIFITTILLGWNEKFFLFLYNFFSFRHSSTYTGRKTDHRRWIPLLYIISPAVLLHSKHLVHVYTRSVWQHSLIFLGQLIKAFNGKWWGYLFSFWVPTYFGVESCIFRTSSINSNKQ